MKKKQKLFEQPGITVELLRWTLLVLPLAVAAGALTALFLWSLDQVTRLRWQHGWLLYLLPAAGALIYFLYKYLGKNSDAGNNLIMDEIHEPGGGVPARMAPLVLLSTLATHLFGGSAGREGTAVQMGGSLAAFLARNLRLTASDTRILLTAGIAAGFGAVFGTPVTGAIFAMEVLAIGTIRYDALLPCLVASIIADLVCTGIGIHHTLYKVGTALPALSNFSFLKINPILLILAIIGGVAFGLTSWLFAQLQHNIRQYARKLIKVPWMIPVTGGLLIILLCWLLGTDDYLGLGVTGKEVNSVSIVSSFHAGGAGYWSWFWKLLFTAVTLGTGFKGGEVTPLFFIGAALGNTIATITGAPVDLFAAMGFIAVFAGATNTPVACTIMGIELFGGEHALYYAVACFTAYYFSGHTGIYTAQRQAVDKWRG